MIILVNEALSTRPPNYMSVRILLQMVLLAERRQMLAKDRRLPKVPTEAGRANSVILCGNATRVDVFSATLTVNHLKVLISFHMSKGIS